LKKISIIEFFEKKKKIYLPGPAVTTQTPILPLRRETASA